MGALRRLGQSVAAVLGLIVLAATVVALAGVAAPAPLVGLTLLGLAVALAWVGRLRPGPAVGALALVGLGAALTAFVAHDRASLWLGLLVAVAVATGLADDPLRQRLAPGVRAVQLPGLPSDDRPETPGPFSGLVLTALGALGLLLVLSDLVDVPDWVGTVLLLAVVAGLGAAAVRLRSAVHARRRGTSDAAATQALEAYAPQFYIYFSGPADGDYQIRMWLPYLRQLGVPFAVLSREPRLLPRAQALTDVPVVLCERLAALDAVMVPSVRTVFYVNTHHQCVDGVRYLDRTHVHLNHGDSDKPSSYHPMISMFDQVFVAGQAAIDRFARNGVVVPDEKFVLVGRPQVSEIAPDNHDPIPGRPTVLYAPTWRGGVRDMSLSSLPHGERVVRALLDQGARVAFRPHPLSLREKDAAQSVSRIDALLAEAATADAPHLLSSATARETITESFNRSDALVTDVSSLASDYLQSGKPMAVVDLGAVGGQPADPDVFPVVQGAYVLDLGRDVGTTLASMLGDDPMAHARQELRTYYLGAEQDSAASFIGHAAASIRNMR